MNTYLLILTFLLIVSLIIVAIMYFRKPTPTLNVPDKPCKLTEMGQLEGYERYTQIGAFKDGDPRAVSFRKPNTYAPKSADGKYDDRVFTCSMSCENYKYFALQNNIEDTVEDTVEGEGENIIYKPGFAECRCTNDLEEAKKYGEEDSDKIDACTPYGGPLCNYIYENKYQTQCSK